VDEPAGQADQCAARDYGLARHCMLALGMAEWSVGGTPVAEDRVTADVFCAVALVLLPALAYALRHDARNLLALLAATARDGDGAARPLREALPALARALGDAHATPAWARDVLRCLGAAVLEKGGHVARWTLGAWDRCERGWGGVHAAAAFGAARRDWWVGVRAELDPLHAAECWLARLDRTWADLASWLLPAPVLGALGLTADLAGAAVARGMLRYASPSRVVLALAAALRSMGRLVPGTAAPPRAR